MKILIVDDRTNILDAMGRYLQDLGHDTLKAQFATDALHLLNMVSAIDLIITDYSMPGGMNGIELAQEIRTRGFKMPIWLLSASNINEKMAEDAGIEKVFEKGTPEIFFAIKNFWK